MKKLIFLTLVALVFPSFAVEAAPNPLENKLIALDAGHGGSESGAVNGTYGVAEKDVNLATVLDLKARLEANGAIVVMTREADETINTNKQRVEIALSKCQLAGGRKCDILVSVHHNGSTTNTVDGTMILYNEKKDKALATALHNSLIAGLNLPDLGYDNGGWGITVYGNLVSSLTEGYFITNDNEAQLYLAGTRVPQEAQALYTGLLNYFSTKTGKR